MIEDYFEIEHTGGSKDSLEITVNVKADKVYDLINEVRASVIKQVLEIIDTAQTYKMQAGDTDTYVDKRVVRKAVEELERRVYEGKRLIRSNQSV